MSAPISPSEPMRESGQPLQRRLYDECVTANWDPDRGNTFAEECAHLHEEVSEAFRAWRLHQDAQIHYGPGGKPEGVPIELADVLIGLFYNAEVMGFDLLEAVEIKHRFNLTRDYVAEGRQLHSRPIESHTRTSTHGHGPDYCAECSEAITDWVMWPCQASVHSCGDAAGPTPGPPPA